VSCADAANANADNARAPVNNFEPNDMFVPLLINIEREARVIFDALGIYLAEMNCKEMQFWALYHYDNDLPFRRLKCESL